MKILLVAVHFWLPSFVATQLAGEQRVFADNLTANLYVKENECTSSLGVSMAFSLVYPSMVNDSKSQVEAVMGFPGNQSELAWNLTTTQLNTVYKEVAGSTPTPTVVISNVVWVDNQTTVNSTFADILQGLLKPIAFADRGAGDQVNAWVNDATRGLIPNLVAPGPLEGTVLAVNSIYLKAGWSSTFKNADTNQDTFYASGGRAATVSKNALFMHQVARFPYSDTAVKGFQVAQLPFRGGSLSMFIALPTSDTSGRILSTTLIDAIPALQGTNIALALPKFVFESIYKDNLKKSLQKLGVTAPFISGLSIFENDCSRFISRIIQKTKISVDEDGVEAAAVTAINELMSCRIFPNSTLFLADHPFQFFIYEQETKLVLFEGVVGNPVAAAGAAAPGLMAKHNDSDFWSVHFRVTPIVVAYTATPPAGSSGPDADCGGARWSSRE
jgi:serpin B